MTVNQAIAHLFPRIPEDVKRKAIALNRPYCINYDADFSELFASPFFIPRPDEENQLTIAIVRDGRVFPSDPSEKYACEIPIQ